MSKCFSAKILCSFLFIYIRHLGVYKDKPHKHSRALFRYKNPQQLEFHNHTLKLFEHLEAVYEKLRLPPGVRAVVNSVLIPVTVYVSDPPEITMKPRNLQVKAGGIAAFYCAARGDPPPVIQWKKNGKRVSGQYDKHFSCLIHLY